MYWNRFLNVILLLLLIASFVFAPTSLTSAQDPSTAVFSLPDESLQFDVPEGWVAEDHGIWIIVTNDEALLEVNSARLEEGDVIMLIVGATEYSSLGLPEGTAARESLEAVVSGSQSNIYGEIYESALDDRAALRTDYTSTNGSDGFYMAFDTDDGRTLVLITFALSGEFASFESDLLDIAASIETSEPPEDADYRLVQDVSFGPDDADVTIMEIGTYGCHACRSFHHNGFTDSLIAMTQDSQYDGRVQFVFVNFPVISPFNDPISAEIAQCIIDQGTDDFWRFHDAIFDISDGEYASMQSAEDFIQFAITQGIDTTAVETCMDNRTHRSTVNYNLNRASRLGVRGTPTFFVNGQQVSPDSIESAVQAALSE